MWEVIGETATCFCFLFFFVFFMSLRTAVVVISLEFMNLHRRTQMELPCYPNHASLLLVFFFGFTDLKRGVSASPAFNSPIDL